MCRCEPILAAQGARELKRDERTHTVSEQGDRPVKLFTDHLQKLIDECRQISDRFFVDAVLSPGQLDCAYFHPIGQVLRPGPEAVSATPSVRKTQQSYSRTRPGAGDEHPALARR